MRTRTTSADRGPVAQGPVAQGPGEIRFERSLPLDTARESGAMLAYAMNGRPLPLQHGYPVRLVVPGWYGVASVKWLTAIELTDRPFDGYFQAVKYWYEFPDDPAREPVTLQRVRALITGPGTGEQLSAGSLLLRGVAWSGLAPIARVDVSVDHGTWQPARLIGERREHCWQRWELRTSLTALGSHSIRARATDLAGRTQPRCASWNRHGHGNNAVHEVTVRVSPAQGAAAGDTRSL